MPTALTLIDITRRFCTEEVARAYFERMRWPNGPVCPHCGSAKKNYALTPNKKARIREGLYKCGTCDDRFSVTVGTVMESSHIPLHKWLIAFYMICASKTRVSAMQLQRQLELGSYRTALFLCHRIRLALKGSGSASLLGGGAEVGETCIGGKAMDERHGYAGDKTPVVSLVKREEVRSAINAERVTGKAIDILLRRHVAEEACSNTDEPPVNKSGKCFVPNSRVSRSAGQFSHGGFRSGCTVVTKALNGLFGDSGRNLDGTHHHVNREHLHLYTVEPDFNHNTRKSSDGEGTAEGIRRIEGKRLMYRQKAGS